MAMDKFGTVVVTGAKQGIGRACVTRFLYMDMNVVGLDIQEPGVFEKYMQNNPEYHYKYHQCDVRDFNSLPDIADVAILVNNAGVQEHDCIDINLRGLMNTTKKYGLQPNIHSIVNMASVSAHNGCEFPEYVASKGGVLAYTIWTAKEIAKWGATCNSLSFGGVYTDLNKPVIEDNDKWRRIMDMTPLNKWVTPEECAKWVWFLTMVNKSMSGQDIIVDNMETRNNQFVW